MNILITGGLGFIGSHTAIELLEDGHSVVIVDNLVNSKITVLSRLNKITGKEIPFKNIDVADRHALSKVFESNKIDAVIHFAGLKSVGESVDKPLLYYRCNIDSTLTLCEVMQKKGVKKLIFSSSATVYGTPSELPLKETSQVGIGITNPYGQTKFMIEKILNDLALADDTWRITALRYFNPIGAHKSGLIGEDPNDIPNNLLPYISQVAAGNLKELSIFGNDYETPDGTGIRDYIHVIDLAKGHVAALKEDSRSFREFNLGTGKGTSVLELLHTFEKASGKKIPYKIVHRRPGDVAACYADPSKAKIEFGWKATKTIAEACKDSWRWQQQIRTL